MGKSENGAAAVEFAIIAPLFFVLLFGIIEWSAVLYNQAVITNASREGARFAATFYTNPANATAETPTCTEIKNIVSNYVNAHFLNFTSNTPFGPANVTCPNDEGDDDPIKDYSSFAGYVTTVGVEYQYGFLVFGNLVGILSPGGGDSWTTITLSAQTSMRNEYQGPSS